MNCGGCIECCTAFPVLELEKGPWTVCEHSEDGGGCRIYAIRPESCRRCKCAYMQMKKAAEDLRPDKCGVIFERFFDVMLGTVVGSVDPVIKRQIKHFEKEGFRVILQKRYDST